MSRCSAEEACETSDKPMHHADTCSFAGHGFYLEYHVDCCPGAKLPFDCLHHGAEENPHAT